MRKKYGLGFKEGPEKIPSKIELLYTPHHYLNADGSPNAKMLFEPVEGKMHLRDSAIKDLLDFGDEMRKEVRDFADKHFNNCEKCRKRRQEIIKSEEKNKTPELPF